MENILSTLPSSVSPAAVNAPKNDGFVTGGNTHATSLCEAFTKDVFDQSRLTTLKSMSALTCEEFKATCKAAQEIASNTDALSGFVKAEGATGQNQYGPVRRVLNQRLSEAKQVFGAIKMSPQTVAEKGWFPAVEASRAYLSDKGVKWDGSKAPSDEQKTAKATSAAMAVVMANNPQEAGESMATYMGRCAGLVEAELEKATEQKQNKAFEKLLSGVDAAALLAYLLDNMDKESLESTIVYASDALEILKENAQA